jgi:hypothetical protein
MKRILIGLLASMSAVGSAHAQCAPTDKIYIDPRLVPKRPNISPGVVLPSSIDPVIKRRLIEQYMQKDQPIVVPFGTGKVLVHPHNPCIQQYIP